MVKIYETKNFIVISADRPLVDRFDGGHIIIFPRKDILDRTQFTEEQSKEFIQLTILIGKAMKEGLSRRGIEIIRINYQDMGNWAFKKGKEPTFHLHIFGRSKDAKYNPYTEAIYLPDKSTGFYDGFLPLNDEDILEIKKQISIIDEEKQVNEAKFSWFKAVYEPNENIKISEESVR